jgi:hypothetical protein
LKNYIYIATVGKTSEKVLVGLRSRPNISKVCLIGSEDSDVVKSMDDIEQFAKRLGYSVERIQADAFNIVDVVRKTNEIIQKNKDSKIVVNVSSGTRVMTIGALIAAYANNTEVIYVPPAISEKTQCYIDIPPLNQLMGQISLPSNILVNNQEIISEILARAKEEYPAIPKTAIEYVLNRLLKNKYEFEAWDTRFVRYPRLVKILEKNENKIIEEIYGPFEISSGFLAKCTNCKSWFGFPIKIGVGYLGVAASVSQGLEPPEPSRTPPPLGSAEYANLMLKSQSEFYCQKCAVLLGLNSIIAKMKQTGMIV